jgi:hypothetical protein
MSKALIALAWLGVGFLLSRPRVSSFCDDVTSCSVLLYGLALFMWALLGLAGSLVWHYWRKKA